MEARARMLNACYPNFHRLPCLRLRSLQPVRSLHARRLLALLRLLLLATMTVTRRIIMMVTMTMRMLAMPMPMRTLSIRMTIPMASICLLPPLPLLLLPVSRRVLVEIVTAMLRLPVDAPPGHRHRLPHRNRRCVQLPLVALHDPMRGRPEAPLTTARPTGTTIVRTATVTTPANTIAINVLPIRALSLAI